MDNLAGAANLIGVVNDMKEEHCVVSKLDGTIPLLINMLSKEDDRASLIKGDFLFLAGHFASSLEIIFQQLRTRLLHTHPLHVSQYIITQFRKLFAQINEQLPYAI